MTTRSVSNRVDYLEVSIGSIEKGMQEILNRIERIGKQQEEVASKLNASLSSEGENATGSGVIGRNFGGNHDPNRSLTVKGRKLEIPAFNGTDPDGWIIRAERYFSLNRLNQEEQINVSFVAFEGDALKWFRWEHHWRPFRRWEDLKMMILRQFCSSGEQFQTLKQGVTMERDTDKNLQEKKGEDTTERDRDRGRVGLIDSPSKPLPPLSSLSPPSSSFPLSPSISSSMAEKLTSPTISEEVSSKPILGNLLLSKPKPNQVNFSWPKLNPVNLIWPGPNFNTFLYLIDGLADGENGGSDNFKELSPPLPPALIPIPPRPPPWLEDTHQEPPPPPLPPPQLGNFDIKNLNRLFHFFPP